MNDMKKPLVLGIGEFLWDILPDGKKAGGAPVNFTYYASKSGVRAVAFSAVGDDPLGKELLKTTEEFGIGIRAAVTEYPTGTVDVRLKDGIPQYHINENVAWDHIRLTDEMISLAAEASANCGSAGCCAFASASAASWGAVSLSSKTVSFSFAGAAPVSAAAVFLSSFGILTVSFGSKTFLFSLLSIIYSFYRCE